MVNIVFTTILQSSYYKSIAPKSKSATKIKAYQTSKT